MWRLGVTVDTGFKYLNGQMDRVISEVIHNDVHAELTRLLLIHGLSFKDASEEVGLSWRYSQTLYAKYIQEIAPFFL